MKTLAKIALVLCLSMFGLDIYQGFQGDDHGLAGKMAVDIVFILIASGGCAFFHYVPDEK